MNKYIIIILLFNSISSQIIDNEFLKRVRQDFSDREKLISQINNYREED